MTEAAARLFAGNISSDSRLGTDSMESVVAAVTLLKSGQLSRYVIDRFLKYAPTITLFELYSLIKDVVCIIEVWLIPLTAQT